MGTHLFSCYLELEAVRNLCWLYPCLSTKGLREATCFSSPLSLQPPMARSVGLAEEPDGVDVSLFFLLPILLGSRAASGVLGWVWSLSRWSEHPHSQNIMPEALGATENEAPYVALWGPRVTAPAGGSWLVLATCLERAGHVSHQGPSHKILA